MIGVLSIRSSYRGCEVSKWINEITGEDNNFLLSLEHKEELIHHGAVALEQTWLLQNTSYMVGRLIFKKSLVGVCIIWLLSSTSLLSIEDCRESTTSNFYLLLCVLLYYLLLHMINELMNYGQ